MKIVNKTKQNRISINELKPEDLNCSGCGITYKPSGLSASEKRRILKRLQVIHKTGGRFSQFTKEEFVCKSCKKINVRKLQCLICKTEKLIHLFDKFDTRNCERGYCIKCMNPAQEENQKLSNYKNTNIQNSSRIHISNLNQPNINQLVNNDKNIELESIKCKICNSICGGHLCCYFCSTTMPKYRFLTVDNNIEVCHYCLKKPQIVAIINTICEEIECFICKNKWRIHAFDKDQRNKSDKACCRNCIKNSQKEVLISLNSKYQITSSSSNTSISNQGPETIQNTSEISSYQLNIKNLTSYGKNSSSKNGICSICNYRCPQHIYCCGCKHSANIDNFSKGQRNNVNQTRYENCMEKNNSFTQSSLIAPKTLLCSICMTIWDIDAFEMDQRNNRDEACCKKCFEYTQNEDKKSLENDDSEYEP